MFRMSLTLFMYETHNIAGMTVLALKLGEFWRKLNSVEHKFVENVKDLVSQTH